MKTAILVDTTMPFMENIDYSNIFKIDLRINLEGIEYQASDLTFTQINESIKKTSVFPKTSLPNIENIENVFEEIIAQGYERVFVLCLSKALSGTFQTISLIAQDYQDRIEITNLDTRVMSVGNALSLDFLCDILKTNADTQTIITQFNDMIDATSMYVILGELQHIYKGGRMSRAQFAAGEFLKIRPLLKLQPDGSVGVANKVRGNKKLISTVINYLKADLVDNAILKIYITETDSDENFKLLLAELDKLDNIEVMNLTCEIDAITGTHVGPNTIGIAWSTKYVK